MARKRNRLVYSTDPHANWCERCGQDPCVCKPDDYPALDKQTVHIRREKRRGKPVTVVMDLQRPPDELKTLSKTLKTLCGAGGTVKDGAIEVQGDHREKVADTLREMGCRVKFSGG